MLIGTIDNDPQLEGEGINLLNNVNCSPSVPGETNYPRWRCNNTLVAITVYNFILNGDKITSSGAATVAAQTAVCFISVSIEHTMHIATFISRLKIICIATMYQISIHPRANKHVLKQEGLELGGCNHGIRRS